MRAVDGAADDTEVKDHWCSEGGVPIKLSHIKIQ